MPLDDERLLRQIRSGGKDLEQGVRHMYRWQMAFGRRLAVQGASKEDAEDLFQEAVQVVVYNVRSDRYTGSGRLESYLLGVGQNLWRQEIRKRSRRKHLREEQEAEIEKEAPILPDEQLEWTEKKRLLAGYLARMSSQCRRILGLWSLGYSMKEIASAAAIKNVNLARQKKHHCMKKWVQLFRDNPDLLQPFLNE